MLLGRNLGLKPLLQAMFNKSPRRRTQVCVAANSIRQALTVQGVHYWWVTADIPLNGYFLDLIPPNPPYWTDTAKIVE